MELQYRVQADNYKNLKNEEEEKNNQDSANAGLQFKSLLQEIEIKHISDLQKRIFKFFACSLIDVFLVIPAYFFKAIFKMVKKIKKKIDEKENKIAFKIFLIYMVDIFLSSSNMWLFYIKIFRSTAYDEEDVYVIWGGHCFLFYISFVLTRSFFIEFVYQEEDEQEFSFDINYFMRPKHLNTLGLGVVKNELLTWVFGISINKDINVKLKSIQDDDKEINEEIKEQLQEVQQKLNLDLSYFYFAYLNEDNENHGSIDQQIKQKLEKAGFQGTQDGYKDLLNPIFKQTLIQNKNERYSFYGIAIFIFIKIILPILYMWHTNFTEAKHIPIILSLTGFYFFIIILFFNIMNSEDLKQRNNMVKLLSFILNINNEQQNKNRPFSNVIDITCPLSLESWDNARRIAQQINEEKTKRFEISYACLGIYLIFLSFILISVYGDWYFIVAKKSIYLHQPVLVMNMSINFMIIIILFINRLYYISKFNQEFDNQKVIINELKSIYEDLQTLYDYYFDKDINSINSNQVYKIVITRIEEKICKCNDLSKLTKLEYDNKKKEYIKTLQLTLDKLELQIQRDSQNYRHKFLGIFDLEFDSFVSSFVLTFLSVLPTIVSKLQNIFKYSNNHHNL